MAVVYSLDHDHSDFWTDLFERSDIPKRIIMLNGSFFSSRNHL